MVIPTCGNKRGLCAVPLSQFKTKDTAVKPQCSLQVGDLEMDMANTDLGINRFRCRVECHIRVSRYRKFTFAESAIVTRAASIQSHPQRPPL